MIVTSVCLGTVRWFAPELCLAPPERSSFPSDIWAFGCVILEVTSQKIPWFDQYESRRETNLIVHLSQQKNASKFQKICREQPGPEEIRNLLCRCCAWDKSKRPRFDAIVRELSTLVESAAVPLVHVPEPEPQAQPKAKPKPRPKKVSPPASVGSLRVFDDDSVLMNPYPSDDTDSLPSSFGRMTFDGLSVEDRRRRQLAAAAIYLSKDQKFRDVLTQRIVFQGPGGGFYSINDKGEKVYVRKDKLEKMKLTLVPR